MPYPPSTRASDAIAQDLISTAIRLSAPDGGKNNMMVSVVTTEEFEDVPRSAFVATSGSGQKGGGFREILQNLRGNGVYGGVKYSVVLYSESDNLLALQRDGLPKRDGIFLEAARHCAEPKVLEEAARSGERISGMTTIWWGRRPNEFTVAGKPERWAAPCEYCRLNAENIMRRVEELRIQCRGNIPTKDRAPFET